jgi:hypothetical protein
MTNKFFITLIILILLISCNDNDDLEIDVPLLKAQEYYKIEIKSSWKSVLVLQQDNENLFLNSKYFGGFYNYEKKQESRLYFLSFECYWNENDTVFIPKDYYVRYTDSGFQHILLLGENQDTLFHYKASLFGELNKVFIRGKYYYQYKFGEFNTAQRVFFKNNIDSLKKIKGNNLPYLLVPE